MEAFRQWVDTAPLLLVGVFASFAASLGTGFGAVPVLGVRGVSAKTQDVLMSVAAGIMLAATAYGLVDPALHEAAVAGASAVGAAAWVGLSMLAGAAVILLIHQRAPHEHFIKPQDTQAVDAHRLRQVWLFVIAITLHNFPEGLSVGVSFGGERPSNGLLLTSAIFIQNLPEGFIVALALLGQGYSRRRAVLIACGTGLVETFGGLVGATVVTAASAALPWGLGFAAGAMLFVISHEIIPETHRGGYESHATFGLIAGFAGMLLLTAAFA